MTENKELKCCPFCGGEAYLDSIYKKEIYAACSVCGACGISGSNNNQAAERWNTRHNEAQITKCEIHSFLGDNEIQTCINCGVQNDRK